MKTKYGWIIVLLLVALTFLPLEIVSADTGPKPAMDFTFVQEIAGPPLTIVSGTLYECEQSDCRDAKPLAEAGPQRFSCGDTSCHALAYGFSPYHRLDIQFSDGKTRRSNVFQTAGFNSIYKVVIRQDDLLVESQFNPANLLPTAFLPLEVVVVCACLLGLMAVVLVVAVLIVRRRSQKR
jgi:hypothetical protein